VQRELDRCASSDMKHFLILQAPVALWLEKPQCAYWLEQPVVRETVQRPGWLLVLSGSLVVTCSVVLWLVCGSIRRLMVVELTSCGGDKGASALFVSSQ